MQDDAMSDMQATETTSEAESSTTATVGGVAADQLRAFIERLENLEEEKQNLMADIREVFAEAKGAGFDVKTMRQILKIRKMEPMDRQEEELLLDTYKRALGLE